MVRATVVGSSRPMIDALRAKVQEATRQFPILGKLLDGSIGRADLENLEEACRAAGLVDVAEGLRAVRTDPDGFRKVAETALTQTDAGRELLAEFQELAPSVVEGLRMMQQADQMLEALRRK